MGFEILLILELLEGREVEEDASVSACVISSSTLGVESVGVGLV